MLPTESLNYASQYTLIARSLVNDNIEVERSYELDWRRVTPLNSSISAFHFRL